MVRGPSPGTDALMLLPSQVNELRHIPPALRTGDPRKSTRTAAGGSVPRPGLLPASAWEPPTPTPCSSESAGSRGALHGSQLCPERAAKLKLLLRRGNLRARVLDLGPCSRAALVWQATVSRAALRLHLAHLLQGLRPRTHRSGPGRTRSADAWCTRPVCRKPGF